MGIKIDFTTYNGTVCKFHTITNFIHNGIDACEVQLGAYVDEGNALRRCGVVQTRSYMITGVPPQELILEALYIELMKIPELSAGVRF